MHNGYKYVYKVRDLRNFYKTVTNKGNRKSDDKIPPFLSSASAFFYIHARKFANLPFYETFLT